MNTIIYWKRNMIGHGLLVIASVMIAVVFHYTNVGSAWTTTLILASCALNGACFAHAESKLKEVKAEFAQ